MIKITLDGSDGDVEIGKNTNFAGNITLDNVSISAVQTGDESFVDNDTSIMTSAAIEDKVQAHYSYQYINFMGNSDIGTNWAHPSQSSATANNWNVDSGEAGTTINLSLIHI